MDEKDLEKVNNKFFSNSCRPKFWKTFFGLWGGIILLSFIVSLFSPPRQKSDLETAIDTCKMVTSDPWNCKDAMTDIHNRY